MAVVALRERSGEYKDPGRSTGADTSPKGCGVLLVGARVELTLEAQAEVPEGIPEDRQRIVNEHYRTLKFRSFGFEEE